MFEYKVKFFQGKRAKGDNLGKMFPISPKTRMEIALTNFLNNESQDGWEFYFGNRTHYIFRRKAK
jgi:hypothetical protein